MEGEKIAVKIECWHRYYMFDGRWGGGGTGLRLSEKESFTLYSGCPNFRYFSLRPETYTHKKRADRDQLSSPLIGFRIFLRKATI